MKIDELKSELDHLRNVIYEDIDSFCEINVQYNFYLLFLIHLIRIATST